MRRVLAIVVLVAAILGSHVATAFAQEKWCAGAYDPKQGTNFGGC